MILTDLSSACGRKKIPIKIKVLLLLIWYNAMDTKDNMARRNLVGNTKCLP
jgi:hypothetical protein